jgi:hypothetical protein
LRERNTSRHTGATTVVSHPPKFSTALVSERLSRSLASLDGVVRFGQRAEHPASHGPKVGAFLLESLCQIFALVHGHILCSSSVTVSRNVTQSV